MPAFLCESEQWKADYLCKAFPDCPVIFRDMKELGQGHAHDVLTGKKIKVPTAARFQ